MGIEVNNNIHEVEVLTPLAHHSVSSSTVLPPPDSSFLYHILHGLQQNIPLLFLITSIYLHGYSLILRSCIFSVYLLCFHLTSFSHFKMCTCAGSVIPSSVNAIGINFGQIAKNLPSPEHFIPLVWSIGATKLKLWDADPPVLKAFANTTIEFIIGLGNEYLSKNEDPNNALAWVKRNVQAHLPSTRITRITVGNEVLTFKDTSLNENLLPGMQSVYNALVDLNLDKNVTITTVHLLTVLETSYPLSTGASSEIWGHTTVRSWKTSSPGLICTSHTRVVRSKSRSTLFCSSRTRE